jgi:hypothetical protein
MYALVENNQITKLINYPKSLVIGDVRYPAKIFQLWSQSELNAIGIYEVIVDKTNYKDPEYYINTDSSYSFANGQVTESWGTATAKQLNDSLWTQQDSDDGDLPDDKEVGDVKVEGLKTIKKRIIKDQASNLLSKHDWQVVKATEVSDYSVPSAVTTYRSNVRTKSNEMETSINNCTTVDQLKALYEYTEDDDGNITRPLAEFPEEI